jgi:hypothetical protein
MTKRHGETTWRNDMAKTTWRKRLMPNDFCRYLPAE